MRNTYEVIANLEMAVNEAARDLPEQWILRLNVERGAAWIELITPTCNVFGNIDMPDATLAETIKEAVALAIQAAHEVAATQSK